MLATYSVGGPQDASKLSFVVLYFGNLQRGRSTRSCSIELSQLQDLTLRQSLLVAVGDLLFRHPNVVEPWWGGLG